MRDLMFLGAMVFFVPLALRNAYVAFLLWGWTGVLLPNYYLFGFMQSARFNLIFALIAIGLFFFGRLQDKGAWVKSRTGVLMIALLIHATLSMILAKPDNPLNFVVYFDFLKAIVFCLLMPFFLSNRLRIHVFLIVLAIGLGFHGTVEGLKVIASGGAHHVRGLGGMMSDNNHWAVAMVMSLPLQLYLYQQSANRLAKLGFFAVLAVTIISILGSHSRGAFVGMSMVGLWVIMVSRRKFLSLAIVLFAAAAIYNFAPESWFGRIQTIETAETDSSFLGRVAAWKISAAAAIQNPLFGVGFHGIQNQSIWQGVMDTAVALPYDVGDLINYHRAAHSIYFEVLGDLGMLGFVIFVTLLVNGLYTRSEIKALAREIGPSAIWARELGDLLAVGLVAYMVAGAGVSLGYFETMYAFLMMMEIVKQQLLAQSRNPPLHEAPSQKIVTEAMLR